MAKEKKEKEPKDAEQTTSEEVQVPEKPKKKYSDLGMKSIILIMGGTLIVVILIIFALYWFLIRPDILASNNNNNSGNKEIIKKEYVLDEETIKFNEELGKIKHEAKNGTLKDLSFYQTQDIITNTNPPDWYVVLQIGIEFKNIISAEEGGGHGAATEFSPKLNSEISSVVTKYCGNRNIELIINERSNLDSVLYKELYPIFLKDKIYLHKISIPKFVTQRA